jgi:4-azaleucine resistance transporter AzlC
VSGRADAATEATERSRALFGFAVASVVFGASFGVIGVTAGMDLASTVVASATIFSGGAQFGALGVLTAGGTAVAAVTTGLLLNARFTAMALAISRRLRMGRAARLGAAVVMIDVPLLLAHQEPDDDRIDRIYWVSGVVIYVSWVAGTAVGASLGTVLGDPNVLGFDAALPAMFLALLRPAMVGREAWIAAIAGLVIALVLLPVAPAGVPVLAAALGAGVPMLLARRAP